MPRRGSFNQRGGQGATVAFTSGNGYNKTGQYLNQFPSANQVVLLNPKTIPTNKLAGAPISGTNIPAGTTIKSISSFDGSQTAEAYTPQFMVTLSQNLTSKDGKQGTTYNFTVTPSAAAMADIAPLLAAKTAAAPMTAAAPAPSYNLPTCADYTKISPGAPTPACDRVTVFGKPNFVEYNFSIPVGTYNTLDEIKKIPGNNGYTIYGGDGNVSFAFPTNKQLKLTINNGPNFGGPVTYVYTKTCPEAMTKGSCGQVTWNPAWTFAQSIKVELSSAPTTAAPAPMAAAAPPTTTKSPFNPVSPKTISVSIPNPNTASKLKTLGLSGPDSVYVGSQFTVTRNLYGGPGSSSIGFLMNGSKTGMNINGCVGEGCIMTAPTTPGPFTATYNHAEEKLTTPPLTIMAVAKPAGGGRRRKTQRRRRVVRRRRGSRRH